MGVEVVMVVVGAGVVIIIGTIPDVYIGSFPSPGFLSVTGVSGGKFGIGFNVIGSKIGGGPFGGIIGIIVGRVGGGGISGIGSPVV